jgi:hypothetical protein
MYCSRGTARVVGLFVAAVCWPLCGKCLSLWTTFRSLFAVSSCHVQKPVLSQGFCMINHEPQILGELNSLQHYARIEDHSRCFECHPLVGFGCLNLHGSCVLKATATNFEFTVSPTFVWLLCVVKKQLFWRRCYPDCAPP